MDRWRITSATCRPSAGRRGRPVAAQIVAAQIEDAGFDSIWIGGGPSLDLRAVERELERTAVIRVATGIAVIWTAAAEQVADDYRRVSERWGPRFLLGLGTGHSTRIGPRSCTAVQGDGAVPRCAGGGRPAGARHHDRGTRTSHAGSRREPDRWSSPLSGRSSDSGPRTDPSGPRPPADPGAARRAGTRHATRQGRRPRSLALHLGLPNHLNNFARSGFEPRDVRPPGSDRLVDSLAAYQADESIRSRIEAYGAAGADEVLLQVVGDDREDDRWGRLAASAGIGA